MVCNTTIEETEVHEGAVQHVLMHNAREYKTMEKQEEKKVKNPKKKKRKKRKKKKGRHLLSDTRMACS
jgi:hypothetical protein